MKIRQIISFINEDIWTIRKNTLPPIKRFFLGQFRIILLVFREFHKDNCYLKASALTFYTVLSFVPIVAMLFAIARGFGVERILEKQIREQLHGHEEIADQIMNFATTLLQNTKSGVIVGVGIIFLFWTVIKLLGNIENSFNSIWGVKRPRTFGRKLADYLSMILICPIFLVVSSSFTVVLNSQIISLAEKVHLLNTPIVYAALNLVPYVMISILFTMLYIFLPNTKIDPVPGLVGGIIGGSLFNITQWAYVTFQVFTAKYNAIYGSFAAIPLFFIWLQLSWVIVLFGAEVSFAVKNVGTFELESKSLKANHFLKRLLALRIVKLVVDRFTHGQPPLSAETIASEIDVPIRLVRLLLFELVESNLLTEVKTEDEKFISYVPAISTDYLTIHYVLSKLDRRGCEELNIAETDVLKKLRTCLQSFQEAVEKSPDNLVLRDI